MLAGVAWADSISPVSYEDTLAVGESVTITKTVTVSAGTPTTSKVDVFFLVDTSGSMGGIINSVKTNATSILNNTSGFGDVAWGVGSYEDFPQSGWGTGSDEPWRLNREITTNSASAQAGINALTLRNGADGPESNLHALTESAVNDTVGWRDDAAKFVVWFGDARGHDPQSCAAQSIAGCTNLATGSYPGPTITQTIDALTGEKITVIAVDSGALDGTGQATAITSATGGSLHSIGSGGAGIVATILEALELAFSTYNTVDLQAVGNMPGVDVSWTLVGTSPEPEIGPWTREEERTFTYDVTFTGLQAGTYDFVINAMVDGGVVATETDRITVTAQVIPLPAPVLLLLGGLAGMGVVSRRRRRG